MNNWTSLLLNAEITCVKAHRPPQTRRRRRGLAGKGETQPKNAKLTWGKVTKIRKLYFDDGWTVRQLTGEFGVSNTCMKNIINYQSWVPK